MNLVDEEGDINIKEDKKGLDEQPQEKIEKKRQEQRKGEWEKSLCSKEWRKSLPIN